MLDYNIKYKIGENLYILCVIVFKEAQRRRKETFFMKMKKMNKF